MTEAEINQWIAGLKSVTTFDWQYGLDHRGRPRFKVFVGNWELTIWMKGTWALFERNGTGAESWNSTDFQTALNQLMTAYRKRVAR